MWFLLWKIDLTEKVLIIHTFPEGFHLLIYTSTEGFHPVHKNEKNSNNSYFSRKNHFLSFCWRNFSKVITCSFHFEKNILHKKTLLIHTSPKGSIMYIKGNLFNRRNFCNVSTCGFHYERMISLKKILLINTSTGGFLPVLKFLKI